MNPPKSVSVAGKRVTVKVVPDLDSWGEYHHDDAVIKIAERTLKNPKILRDTLRHELMHAALGISGVSFAERMSEESVVRCFEEIFFPAYERMLGKLQTIEHEK